MFAKATEPPERPSLLDRVARSAAHHVAILGLHPHAGARRVLVHLVERAHAKNWPVAVLSAPRMPLESSADPGQFGTTIVTFPEGVHLATSEEAAEAAAERIEIVERSEWPTSRGPVVVAKTRARGEVELHGPVEPEAIGAMARTLGRLSGGLVFLEGGWERRAFAAPGTSDGVILVLSSGYSATPERSAAAVRYVVETFSSPPCGEPARVAWEETASKGASALISREGRALGVLPPNLPDPVQALKAEGLAELGSIVLPTGLNDEFMIPLVRSPLRFSLVVRDATRLNVSPVYFKAWLKGGGRIEVVRGARVLAVATNPVNAIGPDAEAESFRDAVQKALSQVPVHDVVLEAEDESKRPFWKIW